MTHASDRRRVVRKKRSSLARTVAVSAVSLIASSAAAVACAFDMVKPERNAIDWIVQSDRLVLARPTEQNAYSFGIHQVLLGDGSDVHIDQLVDSAARRKLQRNKDDAVLFAQTDEGTWRRVAYIDATYRDVLNTALDHRADWQSGMDQSRIDYIETLQDHTDTRLRRLAISELDKVPYKDLRAFDLRISDAELRAALWSRDGYAYQAIRVVLLGLSDTPEARAVVIDYVDRATGWSRSDNLGAFAAALIELEGRDGLQRLVNGFLSDPSQSLDKIEQVVMAMSVHHDLSDPELKAALSAAIENLVHHRPETAAMVARQFALRSDWSQTAVLAPLVKERRLANIGDFVTVSVYLARAKESESFQAAVQNE